MSKHGGSYVTSRADVNLLGDRRHRGSWDYFWLPCPRSDVSRLRALFHFFPSPFWQMSSIRQLFGSQLLKHTYIMYTYMTLLG